MKSAGLAWWPIRFRTNLSFVPLTAVVGQFQDRLAPLVAEQPADGREQPLAPVPGVTGRQPAAVTGGVDRPHVPTW